MSEPRLNRKQLLGRTVGAAVGISALGAVAGSASRAGASTTPTISGRVVKQHGDDSTLSVDHEGRVITVTALPGAHVWRDEQTSLSAFVVGDEISAVGHWKGSDAFFAHEFTPLFRPVEGIVTSIKGNRFTVGNEVVVIDRTARFRRAADRQLEWLQPRLPRRGENLSALTRQDPKSGRLIARQVYINE